MKITYDAEADCVYVHFLSDVKPKHFITGIAPEDFDETFEMNLDIAEDGKITGIEIVFASKAFSQEMLDSFQQV